MALRVGKERSVRKWILVVFLMLVMKEILVLAWLVPVSQEVRLLVLLQREERIRVTLVLKGSRILLLIHLLHHYV